MYSVQVLAQELAADFAARGVVADVVFGNWQESLHAGADRVILGLGDFDPDAQNFPGVVQPGAVVPTGATTAAKVLGIQAQTVLVWVHGVAPADTAEAATPAASHTRTGVLLHATIAGLRRVGGRAAILFKGTGTWPAVAQGDTTYGALARFQCAIAIPVLGDAWAVVPKPYTTETTVSMELPGGDVLAATIETPVPAPDP